MSLTYALYFDHRPVDAERRAKQAVVTTVVASGDANGHPGARFNTRIP